MNVHDSKMETEMNRGFLQILVLLVLKTPMYGYMMIKFIEDIGYSIEENTLYPILRRLEKNGLLSSRWDVKHNRPKKYYEITAEGKTFLEKLLAIRRNQHAVITKLTQEV